MEVLTMLPTQTPEVHKKSFEQLYESGFPRVAKFISKMNGSFQDAKDLFHDALVIYYEKTLDEKFTITTTEEAYILGIVKHLWLRKFKHDYNFVSLEDSEKEIVLPDTIDENPDENKLLQWLEISGKKCLDLLRHFYFENKTLREITTAFGYRNEHTASVQKFKCLEKIRDTIKEKAISYEDFLK